MKLFHHYLLLLLLHPTLGYDCHYTCLTCSGPHKHDCLTCSQGLTSPSGICSCSLTVFQEGVCKNACSDGYEQQGDYCQKCSGDCKACINTVCSACFDNEKIINSSFCSPYCTKGSYYLASNCISLIQQDDQESEVLFYAFNEDKNSCEVDSTFFTFNPVFFSSGDNCVYFNNFLIFGTNNLWHSRQGSMIIDNLKGHIGLLIFMKTFFIDQWNVNDRFFFTMDGVIVYEYNVTNNNWGNYLEQNIKLNVNHTKTSLNLTINVQNQGGTGQVGISDLQIIAKKCGCDICDENGCVSDNNSETKCLTNQILIGTQCTYCSIIKNRLPNCDCYEGYYLNNELNECNICQQKCLTCFFEDSYCTTCKQNYLIPPLCDCIITTINGVVLISQNIPQIQISFDLELNLISQQCQSIFQNQTLKLLGENPFCKFSNNMIQIVFGNNFVYTIQDQIKLNLQNIILEVCQTQISSIQLVYNINDSQIPKLFLNTQKLVMTGMSTETIFYYTSEKLNNLQWQIQEFQKEESVTMQLINYWNQQISDSDSNYFNLNGTQFSEDNVIQFNLVFCNFIGLCSSVSLEIQILFQFERFLHINLYYQKERIDKDNTLEFYVQALVQNQNELVVSNNSLEISYNFSDTKILVQDSTVIDPSSFHLISIDSSLLKQSELYFLKLVIASGEISQEKSVQIFYTTQPFIQIKGRNRIQSYLKSFSLIIQMNNQDLVEQQNLFQEIVWTCIDLQTGNECLDQFNDYLVLDNNITNLVIQKNQFLPYKVVQFNLNAILNNKLYNDNITVTFVEEDFPTLIVQKNDNKIINNCYDNIKFESKYSDTEIDTDLLLYKGMMIQNFSILSYFQFNYTTFRLRLNTYYHLQEDQLIYYRFAIYNPLFLTPSLYTLPLKFNSAPQKCNLKITSADQFYLISIYNCIDDDQPLQYRYSVYLMDSQDQFYDFKTNNRIFLSDYTYNQTFMTNLFGSQIIIGVDVKDIYYGIKSYIYNYSINESNYQFSLPNIQIDDTYITYQISYFLQYLQNQTIYLSQAQGASLRNLTNSINSNKISNTNIFQMNSLLIDLLQQNYSSQNIYPFVTLWNATIQQLQKDVNQLQTLQDKDLYFKQIEMQNVICYLFQGHSYLLKLNDQSNNSRRLLLSNNTNHILQNIIEISNLQLQMQLPNEQLSTVLTDNYEITTSKFTNNFTENSLLNVNISINTYISEQRIKFKDNIYKSELQLDNIQNNSFPLYYVQLQSSNSSNLINELNGSVLYEFDVSEKNQNYQCAIKTDVGWNFDDCKATTKSNQVICECSKIGSTTLIQLFNNFQKNILNLFTQNNFDRIRQQNYFTALFTYIEIILAILFFWYLYYGNQLDQNSKQKVLKIYHPEKVYPISFNSEKNDVLSTYSKQSSLKTFSNQPLKIIPEIEANETLNKDDQSPNPHSQAIAKMEDITSSDNVIQSAKSPHNELVILRSQKSSATMNSIVQFPQRNTDDIKEADKIEKFFMFYKNYHKIFALFYRYDQNTSRPVRTTLLYLSILGQMSVINWFGEVFEFFIFLLLSLFAYTFGLVFKRVLACFLMSKFIVFKYLGNLIATILALFFIFVTISSIPLYRDALACNLWALGFITGFILDVFLYTTIQIIVMFIVILLFPKKDLFRKIIKAILDPVCYSIIFAGY